MIETCCYQQTSLPVKELHIIISLLLWQPQTSNSLQASRQRPASGLPRILDYHSIPIYFLLLNKTWVISAFVFPNVSNSVQQLFGNADDGILFFHSFGQFIKGQG